MNSSLHLFQTPWMLYRPNLSSYLLSPPELAKIPSGGLERPDNVQPQQIASYSFGASGLSQNLRSLASSRHNSEVQCS